MREIIYINDDWYYHHNYKEEFLKSDVNKDIFEKIDLPHTNIELPHNYFNENMYQFISCYVKELQIDEKYEGKKLYLDFEGVMIACDVYLNAKLVATHKGGYTPFSVDISEGYMFGQKNTLLVVVDSTERLDIPPYGHVVDYLTYGGIYREVSLRIVEPIHIKSIYARSYECLTEHRSLQVDVELDSQSSEEVELIVELLDVERVVASISTLYEAKLGSSQTGVTLNSLGDIRLWDLEYPKQYQIKTTLKVKEEVADVYIDLFGFRESVFKIDGFYLNGKKVKLVGLNRHQAYPYVGYAMPERVQKKDADILKFDLGLNIVRTSHYVQSRHFLDRCDEIGLLVFEEIPGWQHVGDLEWQNFAVQDVEDMIKRDYNRPSIILWGVRINESQDHHDLYTRTNNVAHQLDPVRQTGGVRNSRKSEFLEDVYTMNDFIHIGGEQVFITQTEATGLDYKVPYLVSESNGHMYPTKTFDNEAKVIEHAMRHLRVINAALGSDEITGSISWCAFDYNTHSSFGSGDKICHHGVMDMFRNKKYAAHAYASQKATHQGVVLEPLTVGARGERAGGGVVPFTILTNCDYLKIFKDEQLIDNYYPEQGDLPHLQHPPITIYHLLPSDLTLPILNQDKEAIRHFVIDRIKKGTLFELTPEDYQFFSEVADRAGVEMKDILGVIFELAGGWGEKSNKLTVKGYINDKEVINKRISEDKWAEKLEVIPDDNLLSLDKTSYDATRIEVCLIDNLGNPLRFTSDFIEVNIEGPGKVMGPTKFGLNSGASAFWIRTTGEVGEILLKVKSMYFETQVLINVK